MNFSVFIARRYLISKKSKNIINIISLISVIGMAVGTMALIVILSVFNGFDSLIKSLFNSFDSDLKITLDEGKYFPFDSTTNSLLLTFDEIERFSPVIEENVLIKYGEKYHPGIIKGVADDFAAMTGIDSMIIDGEFLLKDSKNYYAVIGQGVSYYLSVGLTFVAPLQIFVPKATNTMIMDASKAFNRKIIYPSGIFAIQQEFDSKYIIVPIEFAKELLDNNNQVTAIEVKAKSHESINRLKQDLIKNFGEDYVVKDRFEQHELLYKIMRSEKWAIFLILSFILIIASFNIIGSLTMLIIDKQEDIRILQSLGADYNAIRRIFLLEGWGISFFGAIVGLILGFIICWAQSTYGIVSLDSSGNFIIDAYPVKMEILDFIFVFLTVMLIGFIAAWYPVRYITKRFVSTSTM